MAVRPMIFSAPMVRALLDGRKGQTRRLLKPQPTWLESSGRWQWELPARAQHLVTGGHVYSASREWHQYVPHEAWPYAPGDLCWVRETWSPLQYAPDGSLRYDSEGLPVFLEHAYAADWPGDYGQAALKWRSPIHMPRWASRLTLAITDVRVQRLQEISEEDAFSEGIVTGDPYEDGDAVDCFRALWDSLHKPGVCWADNPWVICLGFICHHRNVDEVLSDKAA